MCVCMRERESEGGREGVCMRERDGEREREKESESERVFVCVPVRDRDRGGRKKKHDRVFLREVAVHGLHAALGETDQEDWGAKLREHSRQ